MFADCPVGVEIPKAHRRPGVGPGGDLYQKCEHCQGWDAERDRRQAERRAQREPEWALGFPAPTNRDRGQAQAADDHREPSDPEPTR
ncbi:hypothetical protein EGT67_00425 [Prescottella agglutinans]|uniref:Uncharacterized protein n=1 Tax=Prescottella agglutinans TaxID=1644129 RepID=A0A3S3ECS5_9NOCA|nr:hypothetical protein EGT67_00425 [Prescottella agglutinans]